MSVPFDLNLLLGSRFCYCVPILAHELIFNMFCSIIGTLQPILTKTKGTSDSISPFLLKKYPPTIHFTVVFRKVIFVYLNQFTLNLLSLIEHFFSMI